MSGDQIIQEVMRYLEDESYNYAILIDGTWGSGKTFFVKNQLIPYVSSQEEKKEKARKIKYISLYGCKSIQDIQEDIVWCIAEDISQKVFRKIVPNKLIRRRQTPNNKRFGFVTVARKITSAAIKLKSPKANPYELAADWLSAKNYIFVFDDLERCVCPFNEVFGYINGLVEHEGIKVILVANEKEITQVTDNSSDALEYMVAIQEKIEWPSEEKGPGGKKQTQLPIGLEELEKRKSILFPQKNMSGDYKRIREKLIGVTLRFSAEILDVCTTMVNQTPLLEAEKSVLISQLEAIRSVMKFRNHYNLRTFQFFLSRITILIRQIRDIGISEKYNQLVFSEVIGECFRATVKYKANISQPKWEPEQNMTRDLKFPSVVFYVEGGELLQDRFKNEVEKYINELENAITPDDPFNLLNDKYFLNTQEWCEEKIRLLLERLKDNVYPRHMYLRIIALLCRLQKYGFSSNYMDEAKQYMICNVKNGSDTEIIDTTFLHLFDDEIELRTKIKNIADEVNQVITENNGHIRHLSINEILKSDNWSEELEEYLIPDNGMYYVSDEPVFCQADSLLWYKTIKKSNLEDIHSFRSLLRRIYPQGYKRENARLDIPVLKGILELLEKDNETDLIKKAVFGWLKEQLREIIKTNANEEA